MWMFFEILIFIWKIDCDDLSIIQNKTNARYSEKKKRLQVECHMTFCFCKRIKRALRLLNCWTCRSVFAEYFDTYVYVYIRARIHRQCLLVKTVRIFCFVLIFSLVCKQRHGMIDTKWLDRRRKKKTLHENVLVAYCIGECNIYHVD